MGQSQDWQSCVVRIDLDEDPQGTGFFVAQGLVLTCRHVLESYSSDAISLVWQDQRLYITKIQIPEETIDLALLSLENPSLVHDWVVLTNNLHERELLKTFGFPELYPQGDPLTLEFEGWVGDRQLLKLKGGQIEGGFSGAPLVTEQNNEVCGVINKTRDEDFDLGGRAIPTAVVWDLFPDLKPIITTFPKNPFTPRSGRIQNPTQFFGRERELRNVFDALNSGSSVAVVGDHQIGKSSFLMAIAHQAPSRLNLKRRPVYLDFQNICDDADFYDALCCELGLANTCKGFKLKREVEKLERPVLLLLDEIEKMMWAGFTLQIRWQLRGLSEDYDAPLKLVVAASINLDELFSDSPSDGSPLQNICLNEYLSVWDAATVEAFIHHRLAPTPIRFSTIEIQTIIHQTRGHPQKVMMQCYELYNQYKEQSIFNI